MDSFAISSLVTAIFSFGLAFFVILKNKKSDLNRGWFWVSFLMGAWSLGLWGVVSAKNYNQAWYSQCLLDISAVFIPIFYYKFILILLKIFDNKKKSYNVIFLIGVFFSVFSLTPLFKKGMMPLGKYNFNYWVNPGPFYLIFPICFSLLLIYSFYLGFKYYKNFSGVARKQILLILASGIVGLLGGSTNFFPQMINVYPVGNYFVMFYVALVAYAILKYRLMDIRTIESKIYTYFLIAVYAYSFFYVVALIDEYFFESVYSFQALIFAPIFALIFAVFFLPILKKIQESSDVIFFQGYNPRSIIKDVALQFSSVINLSELLTIISAEFKKILATEELDVFLFEKDGRCVSVNNKKDRCIMLRSSIYNHVIIDQRIVVRDEINHDESNYLGHELDKFKAKIMAPLVVRKKVIGAILLGEKMDSSPYTKEDLEFLEIISSQAAVAIENAHLYQEVEDFNKNLQKKVDEQTKEITEKADHLKKLMDMRSEFLDITSHQLRTPVTVVKGVLSMIEEGSVPKSMMKSFVRGALDKSIKLGEIINDILRASEMDTDKFTLNIKEVDLNPIMEKIEEDKKTSMQVKKKIKLTFALPKEPLPIVMTDAKYIEQAIVNLVNNSFQYTIEGYIKVTAEVTKKSVVVRVADSGIGIPKESIPKLFQKFGRAENAVATYTDGSGLGLFIIKQIVDATPGAKIEIEQTEINKGTTFALTLPIKPVTPAPVLVPVIKATKAKKRTVAVKTPVEIKVKSV